MNTNPVNKYTGETKYDETETEKMKPYTIRPARGKIRSATKIAFLLGIYVKYIPRDAAPLNGRDGISHFDNKNLRKEMFIANDLPIEEKRLTIAHELAHFFLGHILGKDFTVPYEQMEFEAEALGFILYNFLYGIDGGRK